MPALTGRKNGRAKNSQKICLPPVEKVLEEFDTNNQARRRWVVWAALIVFSLLVRYTVGFYPYSGYNSPPKFGDYECQRHWMEICYHLPPREWYRNTTVNDRNWWGLDYPPLSGYWSSAWGAVANRINESWVELETSRGLESSESKMFMRLTVIAADVLLYIPSVVAFVLIYYADQPWTRQTIALATLLLQPGLILIDHGHFQYNSVSLALTLWGITLLTQRNPTRWADVLAAICYSLALNYKQMTLYYALTFFAALLGRAMLAPGPLLHRIGRVALIGISVLATFAVLWWPWLSLEGIMEVLTAVFPVGRGLYEDKVANIWCSISPVIKLKQLYSVNFLTKMCAVVTLAMALPKVLYCLAKPSGSNIVRTLFNVSLAFFLCSYHVHEKSALLPALPASLMVMHDPVTALLFNVYTAFSMYPLLKYEGLAIPYLATLMLFVCASLPTLAWAQHSTVWPRIKLLLLLSGAGMAVLHVCDAFVPPPAHLPDLWRLLMTTYSCAHFVLLFLMSWLPRCPYDPTEPSSKKKK